MIEAFKKKIISTFFSSKFYYDLLSLHFDILDYQRVSEVFQASEESESLEPEFPEMLKLVRVDRQHDGGTPVVVNYHSLQPKDPKD